MSEQTKQIFIEGIAIKAGVSRNNINYTAEELSKAFKELENKPILLDHESRVLQTVGKVIRTEQKGDSTFYKGWIKGDDICERIEDGRCDACSIGAFCEQLLKESEEDEAMTAVGIHYLELSLTPTPGIPSASVKQIIQQQERIRLGEKIKMTPLIESFKIKEEIYDTSTDSGTEGKPKAEKTVDGSGKIPSETMSGKDLRKGTLNIKCPICGEVHNDSDKFEDHLIKVHQVPDEKVDDLLRKYGLQHPEHEEKEEDLHSGNDKGFLKGANEEPKESIEDYQITPEDKPKKITIDPVALADEIQKQKDEHPEFEIRDIVKLAVDHLTQGNYQESFVAKIVETISDIYKKNMEEKMVKEEIIRAPLKGEETAEQPVGGEKPSDVASQKPGDYKGGDVSEPVSAPDTEPAKSPFGSKEEEEAFKAKLAYALKKEEECSEEVDSGEDDKKEGEDKMAEEKVVAQLKEQVAVLTKSIADLKNKSIETKGVASKESKTKSLKELGYRLESFGKANLFYREANGPKGTYVN